MIKMLTKAQKEELKWDADRTNLDMDEIAPLLSRIIDGLPELSVTSCEGCKWKDNNEHQLTNKYVLCPFCTRYYKDRYQKGD